MANMMDNLDASQSQAAVGELADVVAGAMQGQNTEAVGRFILQYLHVALRMWLKRMFNIYNSLKLRYQKTPKKK